MTTAEILDQKQTALNNLQTLPEETKEHVKDKIAQLETEITELKVQITEEDALNAALQQEKTKESGLNVAIQSLHTDVHNALDKHTKEKITGDLKALVEEIEGVGKQFLYLPPEALSIAIMWCILSRFQSDLLHAPVLLINANFRNSGKSTFQKFLTALCKVDENDRFATFTAAGLRQFIHENPNKPLFLDEFDTTDFKIISAATGLINSGFERGGAKVINANGIFDTFGFKCIAGIDITPKLAPATLSRTIEIFMERNPDNNLERYENISQNMLADLAEKIDSWCIEYMEIIARYLKSGRSTYGNSLINRDYDVWSRLILLSELIGDDRVEMIKAFRGTETKAQGIEPKMMLLIDSKAVIDFEKKTNIRAKGIRNTVLVEQLKKVNPEQWGKLTSRSMLEQLRTVQIEHDKNVEGSSGIPYVNFDPQINKWVNLQVTEYKIHYDAATEILETA